MDLGSSCNLGGSCNLAAAGEEAGRRSWREELAISGELQHQDLELARPREEGGDLQLCASHPPPLQRSGRGRRRSGRRRSGRGRRDLGVGVGDGIWLDFKYFAQRNVFLCGMA